MPGRSYQGRPVKDSSQFGPCSRSRSRFDGEGSSGTQPNKQNNAGMSEEELTAKAMLADLHNQRHLDMFAAVERNDKPINLAKVEQAVNWVKNNAAAELDSDKKEKLSASNTFKLHDETPDHDANKLGIIAGGQSYRKLPNVPSAPLTPKSATGPVRYRRDGIPIHWQSTSATNINLKSQAPAPAAPAAKPSTSGLGASRYASTSTSNSPSVSSSAFGRKNFVFRNPPKLARVQAPAVTPPVAPVSTPPAAPAPTQPTPAPVSTTRRIAPLPRRALINLTATPVPTHLAPGLATRDINEAEFVWSDWTD